MVAKLPQMLLGILFVVAGFMKLFIMKPEMFAGMIEMHFGMIGLVGGFAVAAAWIIAIAELLGGLALLLCKFVPAILKKVLISILIVVMIGAIVFIHVKNGDLMSALKDLILLSILVAVCKQSCGEMKACDMKKCADKKCADGTCKA